jgi:SHAQKYF class myb-like DNA-binding protein
MATAATASSGGQGGSSGENTGRWTAEEHNLFLQGLELHGKGWKKIAGLIKSRTVVQIRTHAQKYFQKLAKAKQNGEDVTMAGGCSSNGGAVAGSTMMMGDGGRSSLNGGVVPNAAGSALSTSSAAGAGHVSLHTNKRRKQTSGTKRKAIQSVVASARRQGKKKVAASSTRNGTAPVRTLNPIIDSVAPALAPYVLPTPLSSMRGQQTAMPNTTGQGATGGTILEDSLFRFLTPAPVVPPETQVNPVARQAGANPITLPTDQPGLSNTLAGGEVSPTGVNDLELYPTWTDYSKDTPSWYSKGSDVDALLDVADTLDWLADTGDLAETYEEADQIHASTSEGPSQSTDFHFAEAQPSKDVTTSNGGNFYSNPNNNTTMSMNTLPRIDSGAEVNVPPLPSLFDGTTDNGDDPSIGKSKLSLHMSIVPSVTNLDEHLFSSPIEEHDFVSTILDETGAGSSDTLAALGATP